MIQANELRHNNYYLLNGKVEKFDILSHVQWDLKCYEPIPLTMEVMDKCGFTRHKCGISGCDMWQGMDGWSIKNPYFEGWLFRGNPKSGLKLVGHINSHIQYLNQLQTLYYGLTGKELEYQP